MDKKGNTSIYLDHNATTPVAPEAVKAMIPHLENEFGNPSSGYGLGQEAREAVENARRDVAALIGSKPAEITFTSGGSESNNFALKGLMDWHHFDTCHVITSAVEHPAILNPAIFLMELGVKVTIVPVDDLGQVDPEAVEKAIRPATRLISIMLANNETGTIQPIQAISSIAHDHGIPLHTDAAQAVGKIPVDVKELGVDLLSIAGHKLYGPKGVGALYIRNGLNLVPLIHGAAQESGRRAGTENVIFGAGLGAACGLARERIEADMETNRRLRDRLQELLFAGIEELVLNGHPTERLPNTLNVGVPGLEGSKILARTPHVLASTGAACHDRTVKLSHVLSAMGISDHIGMGALRFSTGRENSIDQIEAAAQSIVDQVAEMRR
jgi:cysteine desulfurase